MINAIFQKNSQTNSYSQDKELLDKIEKLSQTINDIQNKLDIELTPPPSPRMIHFNTENREKPQFCSYHNATGHSTEHCFAKDKHANTICNSCNQHGHPSYFCLQKFGSSTLGLQQAENC